MLVLVSQSRDICAAMVRALPDVNPSPSGLNNKQASYGYKRLIAKGIAAEYIEQIKFQHLNAQTTGTMDNGAVANSAIDSQNSQSFFGGSVMSEGETPGSRDHPRNFCRFGQELEAYGKCMDERCRNNRAAGIGHNNWNRTNNRAIVPCDENNNIRHSGMNIGISANSGAGAALGRSQRCGHHCLIEFPSDSSIKFPIFEV